jgi:ADP-ribose pyrophosphatase
VRAWRRIEPTVAQKVGYRWVVEKTFVLPDDRVNSFTTFDLEGSAGAAIIALTEDNLALIVRQYRPGPEIFMDELPGGTIEPGEDKESAIKRELLEETGYEVGELTYLGQQWSSAYSNFARHCFLARNCRVSEQPLAHDDHEYIELRKVSISELIQAAAAGLMSDAPAVLMAYDTLKELQSKGIA